MEFSARQEAYIAERYHLLEVFLDKEYPACRSALDGNPVLSERINNALTLPGSAKRELEIKETNRGEHKVLSSYQLSLWKADALVHPRMQDRDAPAWLGLLPKEHLLSKVIQLNKDIAHLKSQVRRTACSVSLAYADEVCIIRERDSIHMCLYVMYVRVSRVYIPFCIPPGVTVYMY